MSECIFCKIIAGQQPAQKIYEDNFTLAFLDIKPVQKGHALVITKKHYRNILDIPENELAEFAKVVARVARGVKKATAADALNITHNCGREAGQAIDHIHFHIIPRYKNDKLQSWPGQSYPPGEDEEYFKKIKQAII